MTVKSFGNRLASAWGEGPSICPIDYIQGTVTGMQLNPTYRSISAGQSVIRSEIAIGFDSTADAGCPVFSTGGACLAHRGTIT
jgi:hypothetical protein